MNLDRRQFISSLISSSVILFCPPIMADDEDQQTKLQRIRDNWRKHLPDNFDVPDLSNKVTLDKEVWQAKLDPKVFAVLREEDTEPPYSSQLNKEKRNGVYICAGCDLPLFTSEMKFDSGTGWPSFFTTIPSVFSTKQDYKFFQSRTEYHCKRCGGHHGHVFNDGPAPTNQRWCNNGLALRFIPADAKKN